MDNLIPIIAILCTFLTPVAIVAIICFAEAKKKKSQQSPEDTRMIQEIYAGLERMEHRVESLETILYDHKGTQR